MRSDCAATCQGRAHPADRLGGGEAGLQRVLVEAVAEIAAGEPGVPPALQPPQLLLRLDRLVVEQRVGVVEAADAVFAGAISRVGFSVTNSGCGRSRFCSRFIQ